MSDDTTRDAFGPLLARLQADMAGMRVEMRSARAEQTALRDYLVAFIGARAGETEGLIETRSAATNALVERLFSALDRRLDQTERSVEERFARIETALAVRS